MSVVFPTSGLNVVGGGNPSGLKTESNGANSSVNASAAVPSSQLVEIVQINLDASGLGCDKA